MELGRGVGGAAGQGGLGGSTGGGPGSMGAAQAAWGLNWEARAQKGKRMEE